MRRLVVKQDSINGESFELGEMINYLDMGRFGIYPTKEANTFMVDPECFNVNALQVLLDKINDELKTSFTLSNDLDKIDWPYRGLGSVIEDIDILLLGYWLFKLIQEDEPVEILYINRSCSEISVYDAITSCDCLIINGIATCNISIEDGYLRFTQENEDGDLDFELSFDEAKEMYLDLFGNFKLSDTKNKYLCDIMPVVGVL